MPTPKPESKYRRLLANLKQYEDVAVAYSGGVDSTLLAYAACEALGPEHVLILHASSSLLTRKTVRDAERIIAEQFSSTVKFRNIEINPLQERSFIQNDRRRCYVCKKLIYSRLIEEMTAEGISTLVDGTNCDDLHDDRPGLDAVKELSVKTPLVEVGFTKKDIRLASARLQLQNAELPSNSCLATRIEHDTPIEENMLLTIERLEAYLTALGFGGCRVRPRDKMVIVEIRESTFGRISNSGLRTEIISYIREHGYDTILLDLAGRQ